MDVREKLVELIGSTEYGNGSWVGKNFQKGFIEKIASNLIAHGVTIQEWIPVSERLPELHTKVLCCGVKGGRFIAELTTWGYERHLIWDKKNGRGCPEVTHWMPLPEPPKGE